MNTTERRKQSAQQHVTVQAFYSFRAFRVLMALKAHLDRCFFDGSLGRLMYFQSA
jgi:hypothetical protein